MIATIFMKSGSSRFRERKVVKCGNAGVISGCKRPFEFGDRYVYQRIVSSLGDSRLQTSVDSRRAGSHRRVAQALRQPVVFAPFEKQLHELPDFHTDFQFSRCRAFTRHSAATRS